MKYNYVTYRELREELRSYIKNLREAAQLENKKEPTILKKVVFTEKRKGFIENKYVNRLVLFLRGTGCSLARETGGCTFCGFYNATNFGEKICDDDYIEQINSVINNKNDYFSDYQIICLYNDGSMLREEEISFNTLLSIIQILNDKVHVKKIVIEARVEDITEEKIAKLRAATSKELELAVGFESADPLIRDLCINKSFENSVFESKCDATKKYGISLVPLIILKPPFLTEKEAIEDYIKSLSYLEQFNLKRIDMELPTVEKHTLVYDLWINNLYRPARLWSVVEILKARHSLGLKTPVYISPMVYSVEAEVKSSNCAKCDNLIYDAFENYNRTGNISHISGIECSCKSEWVNLLAKEKWDGELVKRIEVTLKWLTDSYLSKSI